MCIVQTLDKGGGGKTDQRAREEEAKEKKNRKKGRKSEESKSELGKGYVHSDKAQAGGSQAAKALRVTTGLCRSVCDT